MGEDDNSRASRQALAKALAAVEALGRTDAVVVPATPTPEMLAAGALAGDVSSKTAERIYRAMIMSFAR